MRALERGYTILELIVIIAIGAIISVAATSLFLRSAVNATKNTSIRQVKQNGEYVVSQFENDLRGARSLTVLPGQVECGPNMSNIMYKDGAGLTHTWAFDASGTPTNGIYFDASQVLDSKVTVSAFTLNCANDPATNSSFISLDFTLQKGNLATDNQEDIYQSVFSTRVSMRNQ